MLEEIFEFIKKTGAWGIVSILVVIIAYLLYSIYKITKYNKDAKKIDNTLKISSTSIKALIETYSKKHEEELKNLEELIKDLRNGFDELSKEQTISVTEQKSLIKSIDTIVNRIIDITIDLKSLIKIVKGD